ncbi:MAG: ABC transporter permease [Candidatus Thermoplasmatota archaeon]|jgi:peptide/nickel transport system permease protein|nr:ABC transporter permease [Candidatus Thermoplasmatota archaeon]
MELKYFIIRRGLIIIPTLMGLTVLVFILLWAFGPYQIAVAFNPDLHGNHSLATLANYLDQQGFSAAVINGQLQFTNPIGSYFRFVADLFTGNWGQVTFPSRVSTMTAIGVYLPNTIQLALGATILSVIIAIPLGTYIGARPNTPADAVGRIFSLSGYALPAFWLGYILIALFANHGIGLVASAFPYSGSGVAGATGVPIGEFGLSDPTHILFIDSLLAGNLGLFVSAIAHLVLPVVTITYGILAGILRFIRAGMVDAAGQEFIKTARAKGVPERQVIKKHIRKNALLPTVTVLGLLISGLLGGVVTVEIVFNYLGIGYLAVNFALGVQVWGILALTFVFGLILMITNLLVDVVYAFLDPRIRY